LTISTKGKAGKEALVKSRLPMKKGNYDHTPPGEGGATSVPSEGSEGVHTFANLAHGEKKEKEGKHLHPYRRG